MMKSNRVCLVLEGGGMRGLYTAGVLDSFLDNDIKVDTIIGVSAGVLFGVNYVSRQKGRALRYNKKYIKDKRYISISSYIKTGNMINKDFAYYKMSKDLDKFDNETFKKSNINFYATVTNVETGFPEYILFKDAFKEMELLRATSSLPFISKIVEYNGKKYLDGALSDSIPINKALSLGFDKIIVVLTRPAYYRKKKQNMLFTKVYYKKYPNLVKAMEKKYKDYNDTLDFLNELEKSGKIFVIRPSKLVKIKRLEKDKEKLQEIYDLGFYDSNKNIESLKKYIDV